MSEMSHEDAVQALTDAAAQEVAGEQAAEVAPPAPVEAPAPVEGAPVNVQPVEGQPTPVEPQADELPTFNPDELPEELIPAWRQLQASFTPRLQEAAAIRKQFEELGGQEGIQQAVELARWIQDKQNWPEVYETIYDMMVQEGFEFEDTAPAAPAAPALGPQFDPSDDPDLAPLAAGLQALQARTDEQQQLIERFYAEEAQRREMAALELQQMQRLTEMQNTLAEIRTARPDYTDADVRAIVELAPFYNDDLGMAYQRYEAIVADRLNRYIESKRPAGAPQLQPPAGAGVTSHEQAELEDLRAAEEQAVELMRQLQAAGEFDGEL